MWKVWDPLLPGVFPENVSENLQTVDPGRPIWIFSGDTPEKEDHPSG